jgi:hypothetical protein
MRKPFHNDAVLLTQLDKTVSQETSLGSNVSCPKLPCVPSIRTWVEVGDEPTSVVHRDSGSPSVLE